MVSLIKVENLCKRLVKTMFKNNGKLCVKAKNLKFRVENFNYSQTFTSCFNNLFTVFPSLFLINFIHFSTAPIITTTNNF